MGASTYGRNAYVWFGCKSNVLLHFCHFVVYQFLHCSSGFCPQFITFSGGIIVHTVMTSSVYAVKMLHWHYIERNNKTVKPSYKYTVWFKIVFIFPSMTVSTNIFTGREKCWKICIHRPRRGRSKCNDICHFVQFCRWCVWKSVTSWFCSFSFIYLNPIKYAKNCLYSCSRIHQVYYKQ